MLAVWSSLTSFFLFISLFLLLFLCNAGQFIAKAFSWCNNFNRAYIPRTYSYIRVFMTRRKHCEMAHLLRLRLKMEVAKSMLVIEGRREL